MSRSPEIPARGLSGRTARAAERREAIIASALAEFTDKGFAATRMEDIAARAGVAKGTIYLHFPDKKALFMGIAEHAVTPVVEGLLFTTRQPGEAVGAYLRRIALPLATSLSQPPRSDVIRLLIAEGPRFPELAEFYYGRIVSRALARLRELAAEAIAQGERHDDALMRFPQLFIAPALLAVTWRGLFDRMEPLDVAGLIGAQLDLLFPESEA